MPCPWMFQAGPEWPQIRSAGEGLTSAFTGSDWGYLCLITMGHCRDPEDRGLEHSVMSTVWPRGMGGLSSLLPRQTRISLLKGCVTLGK